MISAITVRRLVAQIGRFGIVGLLTTAIHISIAFILHYHIGLAPLNANLIAFLVAWSVSYIGHFNWTFESKSSHTVSMARFATVSLSAIILNQLIVWTVADKLGKPFALAILLVVLIVPAASFVASKLCTFRQV